MSAFESRWRGIDLRRARARNLNAYDVLTIASMIEREAAVASERRLVAAAIYNRLKAEMPLAIDATLRYGLGIPRDPPAHAPGTVRHFFTAGEEEFCAKAREWGYTEDC